MIPRGPREGTGKVRPGGEKAHKRHENEAATCSGAQFYRAPLLNRGMHHRTVPAVGKEAQGSPTGARASPAEGCPEVAPMQVQPGLVRLKGGGGCHPVTVPPHLSFHPRRLSSTISILRTNEDSLFLSPNSTPLFPFPPTLKTDVLLRCSLIGIFFLHKLHFKKKTNSVFAQCVGEATRHGCGVFHINTLLWNSEGDRQQKSRRGLEGSSWGERFCSTRRVASPGNQGGVNGSLLAAAELRRGQEKHCVGTCRTTS